MTAISKIYVFLLLNFNDFTFLLQEKNINDKMRLSIPVAAQSKAQVCGCWLVGISVSNPVGYVDVPLCLLSVVWCQIAVSATGRSLVQGSPTKCHVSVLSQTLENEAVQALMRLLRHKKKEYAFVCVSFQEAHSKFSFMEQMV